MSSGLSSSTGRNVPSAAADAAGTPQAPGQKSVTVSLRVVLDLSANVELFGYPADAAVNPVYCASTMAAADLSGLFAFLEMGPSGEGISGELGSNAAGSGGGSAAQVAADFAAAAGDSTKAESNLDASGALPFSSYPGYTNYSSLGDAALAWAAHQMFGHPDATAAIDNDDVVISTINGVLAAKLTAAILALPQAELTALVDSVIGQDSSRGGQGVDNNDPAHPQPLAMFPGDTIIVRVDLKDFTTSNANNNQKEASTAYGLEGAAQQYDIVINLA
jgi:hypothetical protein